MTILMLALIIANHKGYLDSSAYAKKNRDPNNYLVLCKGDSVVVIKSESKLSISYQSVDISKIDTIDVIFKKINAQVIISFKDQIVKDQITIPIDAIKFVKVKSIGKVWSGCVQGFRIGGVAGKFLGALYGAVDKSLDGYFPTWLCFGMLGTVAGGTVGGTIGGVAGGFSKDTGIYSISETEWQIINTKTVLDSLEMKKQL